MFRIRLSAGLLGPALGFCISADAAPASEHWEAFSLTAEGVTGDIELSESRIKFENGFSFELEYVGNVPGAMYDETMVPRVYRIVRPQDPALINGNRLCGAGVPYYLAKIEVPIEPFAGGLSVDS